MSKQHKPEQPPWYPRIEEPVPFHTGVPPRDLIGQFMVPPLALDEPDIEDTVEPAPK
jgi:hypothetical protein